MRTKHSQKWMPKIDRVVFGSRADLMIALQRLPDFSTTHDHALSNLDMGRFTQPYGRVRTLVNTGTGTELYISYRPRFRNRDFIKVAVCPIDRTGVSRKELARALNAFAPFRLLKVEFACDFARGSRE